MDHEPEKYATTVHRGHTGRSGTRVGRTRPGSRYAERISPAASIPRATVVASIQLAAMELWRSIHPTGNPWYETRTRPPSAGARYARSCCTPTGSGPGQWRVSITRTRTHIPVQCGKICGTLVHCTKRSSMDTSPGMSTTEEVQHDPLLQLRPDRAQDPGLS